MQTQEQTARKLTTIPLDEKKIIAQGKQRDEPSKTTTKSTPDNKPKKGHTHKNSYTGQKKIDPRTIHTKMRDSKQKITPQSTCKQSHRNTVTGTPLGRNSKYTPRPDTFIPGPVPTQDELQETIADDSTTPTTEAIAQNDSTPSDIAVSSSENGSINDGSRLTARIDRSTKLTPQRGDKSGVITSLPTKHYAKYAPQNVITINKQDQNSHPGVTISDNTSQGVTPKEIQIHMQSPTTITITH